MSFPALGELAEAFNQRLLPEGKLRGVVGGSVTMQAIFDELAAVSTKVVSQLDIDEEWPTGSGRSSGVIPDGRVVALQATVLLVVVLSIAAAALPGADELIAIFGRALLEEAIFIGQVTHGAYLELSAVLPDDNVLGWAAMLAWVLRWLKGANRDDGAPDIS